ncbi:terminase small subunit [Ligaoa zhengdingensis]|jgi:terminase small subunit|uniref:terminase small subunit n=1 Tax=Ligaoa zhengdingensis TaxID=2763658 RepID=UPI00204FAD9C|nr:MAG TPA: Terminase small subunit [Caudoviricetes sp.]
MAIKIIKKRGGDVAKITAKQQAWIDYYKMGYTATEAARLAGYKAKSDNAFNSIGSENLRKLADMVKDREKKLESPRIAGMTEVNEFWSSVMRDEEVEIRDRLKASELRARAAGGFLDKIEHSGSVETRQSELASILTQLKEREKS